MKVGKMDYKLACCVIYAKCILEACVGGSYHLPKSSEQIHVTDYHPEFWFDGLRSIALALEATLLCS